MDRRLLSTFSRYAAAIVLFAMSSSAMAAMVAIPGVFSTGVNGSGTPLSLNTADTHYLVNSSANPITLRGNSLFPITAYNWKDEGATATSAWVTAGNPPGYGSAPGTYRFVTTFDLTGFNALTAQIVGKWSSDNNAEIFLNNASTGLTTAFAGFQSGLGYSPFSILSGFAAGLNTLEFRVINGGTSSNPVALRVEMNGAASPVPLPAAAWLLLSGLAGFGVIARRRKPLAG